MQASTRLEIIDKNEQALTKSRRRQRAAMCIGGVLGVGMGIANPAHPELQDVFATGAFSAAVLAEAERALCLFQGARRVAKYSKQHDDRTYPRVFQPIDIWKYKSKTVGFFDINSHLTAVVGATLTAYAATSLFEGPAETIASTGIVGLVTAGLVRIGSVAENQFVKIQRQQLSAVDMYRIGEA